MNTPRRILHLINTAGPGGAETVYRALVTGLDTARWNSVAVLPEVDWLTHELRTAGHVPLLDAARHRLDLGFFRRMIALIRSRRIEVVHSHLFGPTVEAGVLGVLTGIPVVGTIHGRGDLSPDEDLRALKFRLIRRGVSRVVFVSESLREDFLSRGPLPLERTAVIPNGVDLSRHLAATPAGVREELGIPSDAFLIGAVGNLRPIKRYDLFLHAAARLRERSADYRFVIVGQAPGPLHEQLVALRDSLGLRGAVQFTGFRPDVERLMAAFDLFTITSDSEGFSIATVQAMASRQPIVATRCGGPEEILVDGLTGALVPTGSPEALADEIHRLRHDPVARKAMGAAAYDSAAATYSLDAQISRYEALYEEVITERSSGAADVRQSPRESAHGAAPAAARSS